MKDTILIKVCKYCEGGFPSYPYGRDETCHCSNCGAEWDPITVQEEIDDYLVQYDDGE